MRPVLSFVAIATLVANFASFAASQSTLQTAMGDALGTRFGAAVASVPDLDGDGKDDYLVGSPADDSNGDDAGAVRVYSGATPTLLRVHFGTSSGDLFGQSVTAVGDVNGDNRGDYAIGIPGSDANGADSGKVQVYSGATGSVLTTMAGAAAGDRFGWTIRGIGTFNFTTKSTLAIGAPYADPSGLTDAGRVYLRHWDNTNPNFSPFVLDGAQAYEHFGWAVDASGDPLFPQLVVGAPDWDLSTAYLDMGRFEVWHRIGAGSFHELGSYYLTNFTSNAQTGFAVAVVNVNGIGSPEIVVGAPGINTVSILQILTPPQVAQETLTELAAHHGSAVGGAGRFGESLGSGHFFPGSPAVHLLVGAPDAAAGGRVFVYNSSSPTATPIVNLTGTAAGGRFGAALSRAWNFEGDLNGDGSDEMIIGAPEDATVGESGGSVRVYMNYPFTLLGSTQGPVFGDNAGRSVAGMGDIDGDGVPDFAVGSPLDDHAISGPLPSLEANTGSARIVSGATGATIRSHYGSAFGDELGWSLAPLGDLDLDGVPDYAAGAPQRNTDGGSAGYVRVYGGANGALLYTFSGAASGDEFGHAVGGGSDVNGDGRPDVLIGAPGTANGTVYARSGSSGASLGSVNGGAAGDGFGFSVAGLGVDLTGDGKQEYLVGAPFRDASASSLDTGRAYVMSSTTSLTTAYQVGGSAAGDNAGYAVANAGDVNRDGTNDFIVGFPGYDVPAANAGRARVFSGASGVPLASINGNGTTDAFGSSLAGLGDVDNDGYGDYAIGTFEINFVTPAAGYVKVVSGKTAEVLYTIGGTASECFGLSVDAAGDVDQDGVPDLVAGGPYDDAFGTHAGLARVISCRPKGIQHYGTVPNGCAGPELLVAHGVPFTGSTTFGYRVNHAPANALGLLLVTDSQDPNPNGTDVFGVGVQLLVDFFLATEIYGLDITSDALGYGALDTPITNNPALAGLEYYAQTVWAWTGGCSLPPFGLSASTGLKIKILN